MFKVEDELIQKMFNYLVEQEKDAAKKLREITTLITELQKSKREDSVSKSSVQEVK